MTDLIKATERGLLVTRFWYIRTVNPQTAQFTGLTRDGLFLIEKGEVTQARCELPLHGERCPAAAEHYDGRPEHPRAGSGDRNDCARRAGA